MFPKCMYWCRWSTCVYVYVHMLLSARGGRFYSVTYCIKRCGVRGFPVVSPGENPGHLCVHVCVSRHIVPAPCGTNLCEVAEGDIEIARLRENDFEVALDTVLPVNDGGLCAGQIIEHAARRHLSAQTGAA